MGATSLDLSQIKSDALSSASTFRTLIGLGSSATLNAGSANGVATLDALGKLAASQVPDISLISYLGSVASQAAMLALTGQQGDWCVRSDLSTTWVITGSDPTQIGSWTQLSYPSVPVQSVFGRTGAVVGVSTDYSAVGITNTAIGASNPSTGAFTTLSASSATLSAGTLNGTVLDIAQTWGGTGTYTGLKYNVTDSGPSNAASLLMDLQVGGVSRFYVTKTGAWAANTGSAIYSVINGTDGGYGFKLGSSIEGDAILIRGGTNNGVAAWNLFVQASGVLGFGTTNLNNKPQDGADIFLRRDAAGILAQRNAGNAQAFRLYRTYSDGSNYAFTAAKQDATTGYILDSVNLGSPAEPTNLLDVQLNGVSRFKITKAGGLILYGGNAGGGIGTVFYVYGNGDNTGFPYTDYYTSVIGGLTGPAIAYRGASTEGVISYNFFARERFVFSGQTTALGYYWPSQASSTSIANNSGTISFYTTAAGTTLAPVAASNATLSTGTITASTPAIDITQTWNNNSVGFTGFKFNATDTASNSFSLIADWQIGGVQRFAVSKLGYVSTNRIGAIGSGQNITFESNNTQIGDGGTASLYVSNTFNVAQLTSTVAFGWCSGGSSATSLDLVLRRDAANTLAQRNGTNQQRFNLYGTYSDGANYRRLYLDSTTAGAFTIGVEGAGSGASGNTLALQTGGTTRLTIESSGIINATNNIRFANGSTGIDLLQGTITAPSAGVVQIDSWTGAKILVGNAQGACAVDISGSQTRVDGHLHAGYFTDLAIQGGGTYSNNQSGGHLRLVGGGRSNTETGVTGGNVYIHGGNGDLRHGNVVIGHTGSALRSNTGIGNASPLAKLDIADTWNSNVTVTGASGNGTTATLTFSAMTNAFPVGSTIVVTSVNPSGYNGTFTVTASTTTSVSYANATTGAYVSGGNIKQLFTALKVNVTDTSSASNSLLCDMQTGGTSLFRVDKSGVMYANQGGYPGVEISGTGYGGLIRFQGQINQVWDTAYTNMGVGWNSGNWGGCWLGLKNIYNQVGSAFFRIGNASDNYCAQIASGSGGIQLFSGSNVVEQYSSTNAQTFRLYRTADGSPGSNYQRLALSSTTYSGAFYQTILCESAGTGGDNINLVLGPKGTGAILAQVPDGTATGGNARGQYAVDLQTVRTANTQVASGNYALVIGSGNTASSDYAIAIGKSNSVSNPNVGGPGTGPTSIAIGDSCVVTSTYRTAIAIGGSCQATKTESMAFGSESWATGNYAIALGTQARSTGTGAISLGAGMTASGNWSVGLGYYCTTSATNSFAVGADAKADRYGMMARSSGIFGTAGTSTGDAQFALFTLRIKTTDATATTLMLDGSTTRLTIPSGKVFAFVAKISGIKSDGSAVAFYTRKGAIKNVGGTTSLVGSIETIGTDTEDNASTDVAITADDTNDALQINVTGIAAETWRWVAVVEGVEIGYGA